MTLEMYANDPKSGEEFKMMSLECTREGGTAAADAAGTAETKPRG